MRYNLYFSTTEVQSFEKRLKQLNQYLKYFPIPTGRDMVEPLPDDQSLEIIDVAKPIEYQETLLNSNYDPYETTLPEYCKFSFNLEAAAKLTTVQQKVNAAINDRKCDHDNKGGSKNSTSKKGSSTKTDNKKKVCSHCNKPGHEVSECWPKPGQEHLHPSKKHRSESSSKGKASKPTFTAEQMTYLIQGPHKAANSKKKCKKPKKKKRRVRYESDSTESNQGVCEASKWLEKQNFDNSSSDSESSGYFSLFAIKSTKKRKKEHHTTEVVGEIQDKAGETVP